jgi:DNA-binding FadR family transcriptional regulator
VRDETEGAPKVAYLRIAEELRNRIVVGNYPVGTRLPPEIQLAQDMGVARTSVREALRVLAALGLVETTRGGSGGTVVLEIDHRDVMRMLEQNMGFLLTTQGCSEEEMEEVRELLEVSATWMAATRRTPDQLQRIKDTLQVFDPGVRPTEEQIQRNLRFHYLILESAGNRLLHAFGEPVSRLIYSFYLRKEHEPEYYRQTEMDHKEIHRALRDRDPEAARKAMTVHFANLRESSAPSFLHGLRFD